MFKAVRRHAPSLAPWVECCYRISSHLSFGPFDISSESGVQQGDPLGPALFALTMHDATEECIIEASDQGRPLDLDCFYLDDGVLCGPQRSVAEYAKSLKYKLRDMGLEFADDKRDVYPAIAGSPWNRARPVPRVRGAQSQ